MTTLYIKPHRHTCNLVLNNQLTKTDIIETSLRQLCWEQLENSLSNQGQGVHWILFPSVCSVCTPDCMLGPPDGRSNTRGRIFFKSLRWISNWYLPDIRWIPAPPPLISNQFHPVFFFKIHSETFGRFEL